MKAFKSGLVRVWVVTCLASAGLWLASHAAPPAVSLPQIKAVESVQGGLRIRVLVPPGFRKVTLESRLQLGRGAWMPRAVERLEGTGGEVVFVVPLNLAGTELFRVRADETEPLPRQFYEGQSSFAGPLATWRFGGPDVVDATPPGNTENQDAEVQESDIWRLAGDTLYFFNRFRGLQVIDVSDPDTPALRGQLSVVASGEQMYVLDERHVVLLVTDSCGGAEGAQAWVVRTDGPPEVVSRLDLAGSILESRMVGRVLYVVTWLYDPPQPPEAERPAWQAVVQAFDLTDPQAPVRGDQLRLAGTQAVVQATSRWLLVAVQEPGLSWRESRTDLHLIDIAAADGTLRPRGRVRLDGRVADKFKLHVNGEVLSVIVEDWTDNRVSRLETWSLSDPDRPFGLGQVSVGHGEALFATRFDGDRAYIVTFERIDPLWVVDLRNPWQPVVSGELEIPGWSTYIHPMGDRLVTVGIDNAQSWRVAVQLFDVADPTRPALLSKVPLGEAHSWSEANHDEKAFTVLEQEGLILIPYQEWGMEGQVNRVQLIDLSRDRLQARGVIEHEVQPRRATSHRNRLLSVSARELVTVDATDRDAPEATSVLELAWPVDRLFVVGDWLVEISDGWSWLGSQRPSVRVVSAAEPQQLVAEYELGEDWPVLGAEAAGSRLLVLQGRVAGWGAPAEGDGGAAVNSSPENLRLTVWSLEDLPGMARVGETRAEVQEVGWRMGLRALRPRDGLLVWAAEGGWRPWRFWGPGIDVALPDTVWWPWWSSPGGWFLVFDLTDPDRPAFASEVSAHDEDVWGSSDAYVADGRIYFSQQRAEFVPAQPEERAESRPEEGWWTSRHYLRVLDLSDPAAPVLWPPVNIPGQLRGVELDGALLYTLGPRFDEQGQSDWRPWFSACAFDGVRASLIAGQPLPEDAWMAPVQTADGWAVVSWDYEDQRGSLELWRLSGEGRFVHVAKTVLDRPVGEISRRGEWLLLRAGQAVDVYQTAGGRLEERSRLSVAGCVGFELDRLAGKGPEFFWVPAGDYGLLELEPR